jgi:hypothetical protein
VSPPPLEREYQKKEDERKRLEEIAKEKEAASNQSKAKKPTIESYKNFFFTQKAFNSSVVPRPLVAEVIHEVTYEIKARGKSFTNLYPLLHAVLFKKRTKNIGYAKRLHKWTKLNL